MRLVALETGLGRVPSRACNGPPRHSGVRSPSAAATASRASNPVESSVASGETSGVINSGISVQLRATASQPSRFRPSMMRTYSARDVALSTALAQLVEDDVVHQRAIGRTRGPHGNVVARERRGIYRPFHRPSRTQQAHARAAIRLRSPGDDLCNVQPGQRQRLTGQLQRDVSGVVGAHEEIAAGAGEPLSRAREVRSYG